MTLSFDGLIQSVLLIAGQPGRPSTPPVVIPSKNDLASASTLSSSPAPGRTVDVGVENPSTPDDVAVQLQVSSLYQQRG